MNKRAKCLQSFLGRLLAVAMGVSMVFGLNCPALAEPDNSSSSEAVVSSDTSSDDAVSSDDTTSDTNSTDAAQQDTSEMASAVLADAKPDFEIYSEAVYMVNLDADQPIEVYAKNEDERRAPASLTKIMTAIITLEHVDDLDTIVTVPSYIFDEFYGISVSNAGITRGEEITVRDLLYALMLRSACEAASILADYISPNNIPGFVDMMNEKAAELGCTNTHFTNAHGLDDDDQYTTAYDMYLIAKYAMSNETFAEISCTQSYQMAATNLHTEERTIIHTNYMLSSYHGGSYYYEYVKGIKTGTTDAAGRNLVTVAEKDGYNYMLITLGAPYRDENGSLYSEVYSYIDQKNLYEWAFDSFAFTTVIQENQSLGEVSVRFGENKNYVTVTAKEKVVELLPKTLDTSTILVQPNLPDSIDAPVVKGDVVGSVDLVLAGDVIASVELIAERDVARSGFAYSMYLIRNFFQNPWVIAACVVLGILIVVLIAFIITERKKRKKERLRRRYSKKHTPAPKKTTRNTWH